MTVVCRTLLGLASLLVIVGWTVSAGAGGPPPDPFGEFAIYGAESVALRTGARVGRGHVVVRESGTGATPIPGVRLAVGKGVRIDASSRVVGDTVLLDTGGSRVGVLASSPRPRSQTWVARMGRSRRSCRLRRPRPVPLRIQALKT